MGLLKKYESLSCQTKSAKIKWAFAPASPWTCQKHYSEKLKDDCYGKWMQILRYAFIYGLCICVKKSHKIKAWNSYSLCQAVTNTMANHIMSGFWIPFKVHKLKTDQLQFWWRLNSSSTFLSISQDKICLHENAGGIGINDLPRLNLSFLTKLAWRIMPCPHSFLSKVLQAKYENW